MCSSDLVDPGNVGATIRSAEAFGASSVALGPGCADPFGPKSVRATMGAIFAVPLVKSASLDQLPGARIALVPGAGKPLHELARIDELTLLVGAEREGLPQSVIAGANHVAHIPIHSNSLNAAMAATVGLYALRMDRQ